MYPIQTDCDAQGHCLYYKFINCFLSLIVFGSFHREKSPVRAFAWHPHVAKFAIAWQVLYMLENCKLTLLSIFIVNKFSWMGGWMDGWVDGG